MHRIKRFTAIWIIVGLCQVTQAQHDPVAKSENGALIPIKLSDTTTAGLILPKRCRISKTLHADKIQYLLIFRDRVGWGSDFEMMLSISIGEINGKEAPVIRILISEKDLRVKGVVKWVEDVRLNDGIIEVMVAQYNSEKLPSDVKRSWISLEEFD